ncbi:MAG: hypothetical protein V1874_09200 [Spirochaetota bacterium]
MLTFKFNGISCCVLFTLKKKKFSNPSSGYATLNCEYDAHTIIQIINPDDKNLKEDIYK